VQLIGLIPPALAVAARDGLAADGPRPDHRALLPGRHHSAGQIPATAAEAALAAYPGGVVDRVVLVSNGEYEVHYIGVNWPHHIFVNQDLKVVGAD